MNFKFHSLFLSSLFKFVTYIWNLVEYDSFKTFLLIHTFVLRFYFYLWSICFVFCFDRNFSGKRDFRFSVGATKNFSLYIFFIRELIPSVLIKYETVYIYFSEMNWNILASYASSTFCRFNGSMVAKKWALSMVRFLILLWPVPFSFIRISYS